MSTDPNTPITNHPGGLWIQRAVGAAGLIVGVLLGWLFVYGAVRFLTSAASATAVVLAFLAVIGVLAAFFVCTGWRMAFNRPNRHGSLLTPALWFAIAALFLICGLALAGVMVAQGQFTDLAPAAYAGVFAVLAILAGRRASKKHHRKS